MPDGGVGQGGEEERGWEKSGHQEEGPARKWTRRRSQTASARDQRTQRPPCVLRAGPRRGRGQGARGNCNRHPDPFTAQVCVPPEPDLFPSPQSVAGSLAPQETACGERPGPRHRQPVLCLPRVRRRECALKLRTLGGHVYVRGAQLPSAGATACARGCAGRAGPARERRRVRVRSGPGGGGQVLAHPG